MRLNIEAEWLDVMTILDGLEMLEFQKVGKRRLAGGRRAQN